MPIDSVPSLVQALIRHRLLEPAALSEVTRSLSQRFTDPRDLGRELLQRGWLSAYQLNQILQGKGGDLHIGSYLLVERLSEGPVGELFKAKHLHMRREAAVQMVRPELLRQPQAVERFYQEVQRASQLTHANLVTAYDAGPVGSTHFLAMEYVDGIDLERQVKQGGPLPVAMACDYLVQTARGLQHAVERELWHHDLRPANLLISRQAGEGGQVKIRNLGLTLIRLHTRHTRLQGGAAADSSAAGDYLAPEQEQPGQVHDVRTLLYSLGCVGYFLLSGEPPFPGGSLAEKIQRQRNEEPVPLSRRRADMPADVETILSRLLAKNPDDRYQSLPELIHDLAALPILGGKGATASSRWQSRRQESQRFQRFGVAAGAGALVMGIALVVFLISRGGSPTPPGRAGSDSLGTLLTKAAKLAPALIVQCGKGAGKEQDELVLPGYGYQLVQGSIFDGWDPAAHKRYCWYDPQVLRFTVTIPPRTGGTLGLLFVDGDSQNRKQKLTVQGRDVGQYDNFSGVGAKVDVPIAPGSGVIEVAIQNLKADVNAVISTVEFIPDAIRR